MIKLKNIFNENIAPNHDGKAAPFGSGYEKVNEAPMDKRFQKEWEKNSKVLINHLKHEIKQNPKLKRYFTMLLDYVERASEVPGAMAAKLGTE